MPLISRLPTRDGSDTLYHAGLDETYHSIHGAWSESVHIFIDNGLKHAFLPGHTCRILEVGFGTGLNAWLTLRWSAQNNAKIVYHTYELYPPDEETISSMHFPGIEADKEWKDFFLLMHRSPWNTETNPLSNFTFKKIQTDFTLAQLPERTYDLVYFDAFAPQKQPELWQPEIFEKLFCCMKPGGILVTYCSQGDFRRKLKQAGFVVKRLAGPWGKRHMTRAQKLPV